MTISNDNTHKMEDMHQNRRTNQRPAQTRPDRHRSKRKSREEETDRQEERKRTIAHTKENHATECMRMRQTPKLDGCNNLLPRHTTSTQNNADQYQNHHKCVEQTKTSQQDNQDHMTQVQNYHRHAQRTKTSRPWHTRTSWDHMDWSQSHHRQVWQTETDWQRQDPTASQHHTHVTKQWHCCHTAQGSGFRVQYGTSLMRSEVKGPGH